MELYIFASFLNLFFYMIKLVLNKTFFLLPLVDLEFFRILFLDIKKKDRRGPEGKRVS